MRYALLLALAGCGGPEFTAATQVEQAVRAVDAGESEDAGADAANEPETTPVLEAATHDAASDVVPSDADLVEAAQPEASSHETGAACLPHLVAFTGCFTGLSSSATVAVWVVNPPPTTGCGGSSGSGTPAPCVCDYTCACLAAHASEVAACDGNGGWGSCSQPSDYPIVVCAN